MFVSQNNNRLFLAIVAGMFLASGCSGHSVQYGANSKGEGMGSEEEQKASVDGVEFNADGSPLHGETVDGNSGRGASYSDGTMNAEIAGINGASSVPGSGSANSSNPDPETWANAYLQGKRSSPNFHGDSSTADSTSQSADEPNPDTWAQEFVKENGGPSLEYVNPDMSIVQANGDNGSHSMGANESNRELISTSNTGDIMEGSVQDIYFSFDSWSISAEGAKYLEEDAKWLQSNPEKSLTIEGHCDQRGTQDYNLVLGKKRAEAAREYLVKLGVQSHRIKIVSYGKERPFCKNNTEDCFQENRRNHMVVRMNQS